MARRDADLQPLAEPFTIGDRVRTAPVLGPRDFTVEAQQTRRVNAFGYVRDSHNSHGLCYEVRHDDGIVSYYDPDELVFIGASASGELPRLPSREEA